MSKTLSVVLAVRNEQEKLADCLESIKKIANEIIVVDEYSTDNTVNIAKKFGAKVYKEPHHEIFHITKNKAIDKASCDWILQLDADERVSPQLSKEIIEVINSDSDMAGFWIPRLNFFITKFLTKGGQYPDYTLRLYKRGYGRLPAKDVHEQAEVKGKVGYLKNNLLHMRDLSFAYYLNGLNRYTDIISSQLENQGINISVKNFLNYFIVKPNLWFLKTYFRHRGYVDGFAGFVFALFSSLRFPISYIKLWSKKNESGN